MEYRVLGSFEVRDGGRLVELGGEKPRALLAILLLYRNQVVSVDRLIDELWGAAPPASAVRTLHGYVSRLRKALNGNGASAASPDGFGQGSGGGALVTSGRGYVLRVAAGELDLERFRELVERGRDSLAAGSLEQAAEVLGEALGVWRGPPLADFAYEPFAQATIARLEELHLAAIEERVEADLGLGRARELVVELRDLAVRHPLQERLRGQLMLALYRSGRQAEALEAYQDFRRTLSEELGLEPGPGLQQLELAILSRDPTLGLRTQAKATDATQAGRPRLPAERKEPEPSAGLRRERKVITALFCDVTGSSPLGEELDPEVLHAVMTRRFNEVRATIERHGGTVDKVVGDALMAVFGIPRAHEDDALRAVRAAAEIGELLPGVAEEAGVAPRFRTGVNTGLVLIGEGETLAIGEAVNVGARLQQTAEPGEIVIGEDTLRLVRDAVVVEPLQPLAMKGKSAPVRAFRLISVEPAAAGFARRFDAPLVGREHELRLLRQAWERVLRERACHLFTVMGTAGVGKSRLVAEFLAGLEARVVRGRCLSYGEGITYWPVVEIVKQLGALPEGDAARPVRSLVQETEGPVWAEEIAWGFRKLLEQEARARPLVVVLDDLHWGEEKLLDLVEHVAELSGGVPLLLVCMARPELLERRASWGGGKWNSTSVLLEPLDAAETERLLSELGGVPDELRDRIVLVAEGNPLFLEEMFALVRDSPGGQVEVPATIQALLAARLDQLDPAERSVLERGAVEGRVFHRGAVGALGDGDGRVDQRLVALVRKDLVRPDRPVFAGEDAYRFRHILIRDAAYDALPKATRAQLHRRFAAWLEAHGGELVERDEIIGYHLEQAARYLQELGRPDPRLALAAGERLAVAGRRAFWRCDPRAAETLLERSLTLTRPHRLDVHLEAALARALVGSDVARAIAVADGAAGRADAAGDEAGAALARTVAAEVRVWRVECSVDELERLAREALPLLEAVGDDDGLASVWDALGLVANGRARFADTAEALEQGVLHARRAGHAVLGTWGLANPLALGPIPASEALAKLDALVGGQPHPFDLLMRGWLLAMLDRIDEAWAVAVPAGERLRELGHGYDLCFLGEIAILAADHETAARYLRNACDALDASGNSGALSGCAPRLSRVLCGLGQYDEAEPLAAKGRELGGPEDIWAQWCWREAQALVHSGRGEHDEAARLAREAAEFALQSDSPLCRGDVLSSLGEVLAAAGRRDEARAAFRDALACYERKQVIPHAKRVRQQLLTLDQTPL